jgi:hypothetical protein
MLRKKGKPSLADIQVLFPHSVEVPHGFKVLAQQTYRKTLGRSYYYWFMSAWDTRAWVIEENNVWQYENGTMYCKHEKDLSVLTMVMLSKLK